MSLVVLAGLHGLAYLATPRGEHESVRFNHPLAIIQEVFIDVALVSLLVRAVWQREVSLAIVYMAIIIEHARQLYSCYRTVGNSRREWITVSLEVCVGLYALSRGDLVSACAMLVGVLVHLRTIIEGPRVGDMVCLNISKCEAEKVSAALGRVHAKNTME